MKIISNLDTSDSFKNKGIYFNKDSKQLLINDNTFDFSNSDFNSAVSQQNSKKISNIYDNIAISNMMVEKINSALQNYSFVDELIVSNTINNILGVTGTDQNTQLIKIKTMKFKSSTKDFTFKILFYDVNDNQISCPSFTVVNRNTTDWDNVVNYTINAALDNNLNPIQNTYGWYAAMSSPQNENAFIEIEFLEAFDVARIDIITTDVYHTHILDFDFTVNINGSDILTFNAMNAQISKPQSIISSIFSIPNEYNTARYIRLTEITGDFGKQLRELEIIGLDNTDLTNSKTPIEVSSEYDSTLLGTNVINDDLIDFGWASLESDTTPWIILDLKQVQVIKGINFINVDDATWASKKIKVEYSYDKITWDEITIFDLRLVTDKQSFICPMVKEPKQLPFDSIIETITAGQVYDSNTSVISALNGAISLWDNTVIHGKNQGEDLEIILSAPTNYYFSIGDLTTIFANKFTISISDDGINWREIYSLLTRNETTMTHSISNSSKYIKLHIYSENNDAGDGSWARFVVPTGSSNWWDLNIINENNFITKTITEWYNIFDNNLYSDTIKENIFIEMSGITSKYYRVSPLQLLAPNNIFNLDFNNKKIKVDNSTGNSSILLFDAYAYGTISNMDLTVSGSTWAIFSNVLHYFGSSSKTLYFDNCTFDFSNLSYRVFNYNNGSNFRFRNCQITLPSKNLSDYNNVGDTFFENCTFTYIDTGITEII